MKRLKEILFSRPAMVLWVVMVIGTVPALGPASTGAMQGAQNVGTSGSGWFEVLDITSTARAFTITDTSAVPINVDFSMGQNFAPGSTPSDKPLYLPASSSYTNNDAFSLSAGQSVAIQRIGSTDASGIYISAY